MLLKDPQGVRAAIWAAALTGVLRYESVRDTGEEAIADQVEAVAEEVYKRFKNRLRTANIG